MLWTGHKWFCVDLCRSLAKVFIAREKRDFYFPIGILVFDLHRLTHGERNYNEIDRRTAQSCDAGAGYVPPVQDLPLAEDLEARLEGSAWMCAFQ